MKPPRLSRSPPWKNRQNCQREHREVGNSPCGYNRTSREFRNGLRGRYMTGRQFREGLLVCNRTGRELRDGIHGLERTGKRFRDGLLAVTGQAENSGGSGLGVATLGGAGSDAATSVRSCRAVCGPHTHTRWQPSSWTVQLTEGGPPDLRVIRPSGLRALRTPGCSCSHRHQSQRLGTVFVASGAMFMTAGTLMCRL